MAENSKPAAPTTKPMCGIVMPISAIDDYLATHWSDVRAILSETIEDAGFHPHLVSDAEDVGVIHKRIIQNLYENPIVVCDISGKNPNVMFELGMRLAFDKPTIIVKDDKTAYSFDTGAIEHLEYPRDLRFNLIVDFKEKLAAKIKATYSKATSDGSYTTFLKHFGEFTVAKLEKKEVSGQEFILEELRSMRAQITRIQASIGGIELEEKVLLAPPPFVLDTYGLSSKALTDLCDRLRRLGATPVAVGSNGLAVKLRNDHPPNVRDLIKHIVDQVRTKERLDKESIDRKEK